MFTVLSLGTGVQSSTMALLAAEGAIEPMPDCAIFADTGAEPGAVYDHLAWLTGVLPFPVHIVSAGNLRDKIHAAMRGARLDARPPFFTKTGVGTLIAEDKETRVFEGEPYVMESGLVADLAIVHAWKGDREGNLVYRKTARNFNPVMATAGRVTVAEVEHLVGSGEIDPDHIHTPGIFVQRIVNPGTFEKRIEQRTVRQRRG